MKPSEQILSTVPVCRAEAVWVFATYFYAVLISSTLLVVVLAYSTFEAPSVFMQPILAAITTAASPARFLQSTSGGGDINA